MSTTFMTAAAPLDGQAHAVHAAVPPPEVVNKFLVLYPTQGQSNSNHITSNIKPFLY
jgi:hypothetical protein